MKPMMMVGIMLALAVAEPVRGRADSWCLHDSAGVTTPICAFSSAQDCIHAAIVGPSGMVCSQEAANPPVLAGKTKVHKGRATHLRQQAND
jgi:hypothetical protein